MSSIWKWPGAVVVTGVVLGLVLGFVTGSVLLWLTIGAVLGVLVEATIVSRRRSAQGDDRGPKA